MSNALFYAAMKGDLNRVKTLVAEGQQVNEIMEGSKATGELAGMSILHFAASSGNKILVDWLLDQGANSFVTDHYNQTLLHLAARSGDRDMVERFLILGLDVHAKTKFAPPAPTIEVVQAGKGEIHTAGMTALHYAACSGDKEVVKILLASGAEMDARDHLGRTVLHYAAESGSQELVRWLIHLGMDVQAKDTYGKTPVMKAIQSGNKELIEMLIDCGVDIKVPPVEGDTSLPLGGDYNDEEIRSLLEKDGFKVLDESDMEEDSQ